MALSFLLTINFYWFLQIWRATGFWPWLASGLASWLAGQAGHAKTN
jgi:hypothetical protein